MTQRTANIIGLCKGQSRRYNSVSIRRAIAMYLGNELTVDIDCFYDSQIEDVIMTAFYDFIDTADSPSTFLKSIFNNPANMALSIPSRIIVAFGSLQIKDNGEYINGFTKELIDKMIIELN